MWKGGEGERKVGRKGGYRKRNMTESWEREKVEIEKGSRKVRRRKRWI